MASSPNRFISEHLITSSSARAKGNGSPHPASILIVEDSPDAAELIALALKGNRTQFAASLREARELLDHWPDHFDLILLDLDLPDGDGLGLATELASGERSFIPFIVLSGRSEIRHKLVAFSLGAEDYIEKPFHGLELQARIAARLRSFRAHAMPDSATVLGQLRVETENMRAFFSNHDGAEKELKLSPTEHRILAALVEIPGRTKTREALIAEVWHESIIGHRTIDSHVSNLRRKLAETGVEIESVRGIGYRMDKNKNKSGSRS